MTTLTMATATPDERVAYLMHRSMALAARWVESGLTPREVDRFGRVTKALARALGDDPTALQIALVEDARSEVAA